MTTTTTIILRKEVSYCYPTSPMAAKLKLRKGGYYLQLVKGLMTVCTVFHSEQLDEVLAYAEAIKGVEYTNPSLRPSDMDVTTNA